MLSSEELPTLEVSQAPNQVIEQNIGAENESNETKPPESVLPTEIESEEIYKVTEEQTIKAVEEPTESALALSEVEDDSELRSTHSRLREYSDSEDSMYSNSGLATPRGSQTPEPSDTQKRPLLATDKAVKRSKTGTEMDTSNLAGVEREKYKKRVAGKIIDKLWTHLDPEASKSFEKLCNMSMNKVLERYQRGGQQEKVTETQRVLANHWLSDRMPRSFLARLNVTKLPPTKSLQVRMKGIRSEDFDPLNLDQVLHKKTVCETYLSAETTQLEELEAYFHSAKSTYELDLKYLNEFKKTTSTLQSQIANERSQMQKLLHLNPDSKPDNINVATPIATSVFDPNEDDQTRKLLETIENEITKIAPASVMSQLLGLSDKLDIIHSNIYERKSD